MFFVTGSSGLVGQYIIKKLIAEGEQVRALKRKNSDISMFDKYEGIEWVEGDILDTVFLQDALEGIEIVVHAAAVVSFSGVNESMMYKVNWEGTKNLVDISIEKGVDKFVHISSVAALGRIKNGDTIDENAQWKPSKYNTAYAESKYLAELEVWRGEEEGLNVLVLNPSIIIGPGDWQRSSPKLFNYIWNRGKFYAPGGMNYIDIRDIADIFYQLIQREVVNERFILNAGSATFQELFNTIAKHFKVRPPSIRLTPFLVGFVWRFEKLIFWFTGRKPKFSREAAKVINKSFFYSNKKLSDVLGYQYHTLEESVMWTCEELKRMHHLS